MTEDNAILTRGQLKIEVRTPVHIGSGQRLNRLFMLHNADRQQLCIASPQRLIAVANRSEGNRKVFVDFCERGDATLHDLLTEWQCDADEVAERWIQCDEAPDEVARFARAMDGHGDAYVPGSSLKGAVRGAFLRAHYLDRYEKANLRVTLADYAALARKTRDDRWQLRCSINAPVFGSRPEGASGGDANYDLFRSIQFSDSALTEDSQLSVVPAVVYSSQTNKTLLPKSNDREAVSYWEVLAPQASTSVGVTFLRMLSQGDLVMKELRHIAANASLVESFLKACKRASWDLITQDMEFFQYHTDPVSKSLYAWLDGLRDEIKAMKRTEGMLRLGAGTGFDSKTILDFAEEDVFRSLLSEDGFTRRLGRPGGTGNWLGSVRAPKTRRLAQWQNSIHLMGWVKLQWIP